MLYKPEFDTIQLKVILVDYSPSYRLGDFQCKDYERHGFKYNKNVNRKRQEELDVKESGKKIENISIRYDIFDI